MNSFVAVPVVVFVSRKETMHRERYIQKALRRGHNEGNIRQRTDGRWEVRLSAGIDYKTGKPRRTSTCCNTRQEAIAVLQQQAHEVRTQGWRDPMSVTLGEWYEYWLDTYMKDTVKQSTYASYRSYLNKHFCVLGKILLKKLEPHTLQEFYNYKFREEGLSPKTLRNYHMALHKCLQQAVKEHLLVYNPCDAVTLPSGEKARNQRIYQRPAAGAGASQLPPPLRRVYPLRPVYRVTHGGVAGAEMGRY